MGSTPDWCRRLVTRDGGFVTRRAGEKCVEHYDIRVELQRGNGAKAIEALRPAEAYQLGFVEDGIPVYLRGLAYVQNKQGAEAAAEFHKVIDDRGVTGSISYQALAKLGLARAYALTGDTAKERTAYQDFFKSAREEYEKLTK